jgi:hypothetical protein
LHQLSLAGAELRVQDGRLYVHYRDTPPNEVLLAKLQAHRRQLLPLVDGSTCRWCLATINLREQPDTLSLADRTSLHYGCRPAFDQARRIHAADTPIIDPHLLAAAALDMTAHPSS